LTTLFWSTGPPFVALFSGVSMAFSKFPTFSLIYEDKGMC
jgi:hypothetical protein